jgi:hypothetical protein
MCHVCNREMRMNNCNFSYLHEKWGPARAVSRKDSVTTSLMVCCSLVVRGLCTRLACTRLP